jgi:hypothetical protein
LIGLVSHVLAFDLTWDPEIRAILVLAVAIAVLPGSIYMILGTNLGTRLGFLVAIAGLSGWMVIMGVIWSIYGIGYVGDFPSWKLREVVTSESADDLDAARLADAHDLSTWNELPSDDPGRGEAVAAAGAGIAGDAAPIPTFEDESDYVVVDAFDKGGRGDSFFDRNVPWRHPAHYAIIQVQRAVEVEVEFGEAPPPPEPDESQPVVSVILERDLGDRRLPPVMVTLGSLIIFGITCSALHRRDKAVMAARAAAGS